jgi:hypothetical protein
MFWEADLRALADRKRQLASESDLERALAQVHAQGLGHSLRWVETLRGWYAVARPAFWVAAPLAGLALGGRISRLARWSACLAPLWRGCRVAVARFRTR